MSIETRLKSIIKEHEKSANFDSDYGVGLYNGLVLALSMINQREPIFKTLRSKKITVKK
jgi:hypothetical protein